MKPYFKALCLMLAGLSAAVVGWAQSPAVDWHVIGGGGGTSANGALAISGTIGQDDAQTAANGNLDLVGGFWAASLIGNGSGMTNTTTVSNLVTHLGDSGSNTLRAVITAAPSGSTITFDPSLSGQTIILTNGELLLNKNLTIDGSALSNGISLSGSHTNRIFEVTNAATVQLVSLTLTNGFGNGNGGGGILSDAGTKITVSACTFAGNSTTNNGGAIRHLGVNLTVNECTFAANTSFKSGGAIYSSGSATINQSTFSLNSATNTGGGIFCTGPKMTMTNTIVAGNTASNGADIFVSAGTFSFGWVNLVKSIFGSYSGPAPITNAPDLAPLDDYGGPTHTMPPSPGSPAIDVCTNGTTFATDQRGYPRIVGSYADIGSVEYGSSNLMQGAVMKLAALGVNRAANIGNSVVSGSPTLSITYAGSQIVIAWDATAVGFTLETNTSLTGSWGAYLGPVANNSTTNAAPLGSEFFRLKK